MVTQQETEGLLAQDHHDALSDGEPGSTETSPLLGGQGTSGSHTASDIEARRWPTLPRWSARDVGYAFLFSIPLLLFVPSLVFFIMTLNLRSTLPPSSALETITNLTHRVDHLSQSLSTCNANSSRLATELQEEEQRVEVCRESEKRLAARVDVVEEMLDKCQRDGAILKEQLGSVKGDLGVCVDEKEELKRQMESGVFVQFLNLVGKMGTGGDSWVCSDETLSWSHGYTTTDSPHPTVTIESWSGDLDDAQHSAVPLIFPPTSLRSKVALPESTLPMQPSRRLRSLRSTGKVVQETEKSTGKSIAPSPLEDQSIRIVGYTVTSLNLSGYNGWWRITKVPAFAVKGGTLEFFAQAGRFYGSTAKFKVTVYWLSVG